MDKAVKKALSGFTSLPLPYYGLKKMSISKKNLGAPVFYTGRHHSDKVPRRTFYRPISKI